MIYRRGVSPVVATVLLLVLTIVVGGVVFSVVIPFVNDKLGESKACLDVFEGVEFPESRFNCFTASGKTGFSVKVNKEGINAVRVALIDTSGGSDVFDIRNGADFSARNPNVTMVGSVSPLTFPSVGGQKTYVANKVYEKAEISALTKKGDVCSVADIVEFQPCYDGVIL